MRRIDRSGLGIVVVVAGLVLSFVPILADEPAAVPAEGSAGELSANDIARLIRELDSAEFEVRERAEKKLVAGGAAVIEAVTKAAESESLEVAARCVGVLKELYHSQDAAVKKGARQALEQLTHSKVPAVARRAREVLNPRPVVPPEESRPNNPFPGLPPGGRMTVKVQSRTVNGRAEIDVDENDTKIRIVHHNGQDITVTIRPPAPENGKVPAPLEFSAADSVALKEKHPEAHRYYEKYGTARFPGAFPGNFPRGGGFLPGIAEPPFPINPFAPAVPRSRPQPAPKNDADAERAEAERKASAERDAARKELKRLTERLRDLAAKPEIDPEEIRKLADEIRAVTERLAGKKP